MATVRTVTPGARSRAWAAWAAEWVITVSARPSRARVSGTSPGRRSCGRTLWQMTTVRGPAEAGHHREVRGRLERGEVGEDDQVGGPEAAAFGQPAVRPVPGQPAVRARVGLALGHVDGLLAGVEAAGVLGAPGLDDHVVAGRGEAVGEFGGVPGAAALIRVGGPDQGDFHQSRERTIRSASSARLARIIPVTKIRIVSLAKCSG